MINNNNDYYKKNLQVYLVTGGVDTNQGALSSTELLLPSATSWTASADLPYPRYRLRGATINNKVIVTGTNIVCLMTICVMLDILFDKYCNTLHNAGGQSSNDVLEFSAEEQKWTNVGSMLKKREEHAVSVINYNAIKAYCN